MEKRVYQQLAQAVGAWRNCVKSGNEVWRERWQERIDQLIGNLPHGSGVDGETSFDYDTSKEDKLVIRSSFHFMNDNGMYDGWADFSLVITPSLQFGMSLHVGGAFPKRHQDVKDYLHETFSYALNEECKAE